MKTEIAYCVSCVGLPTFHKDKEKLLPMKMKPKSFIVYLSLAGKRGIGLREKPSIIEGFFYHLSFIYIEDIVL